MSEDYVTENMNGTHSICYETDMALPNLNSLSIAEATHNNDGNKHCNITQNNEEAKEESCHGEEKSSETNCEPKFNKCEEEGGSNAIILPDNVHNECLVKLKQMESILKGNEIEMQRLKDNCIDIELRSKKRQIEDEGQIVNLRRQLEKAIKEKEEAVVRYAVSEKYMIDVKQLKKDSEILESKLKRAMAEKTRICTMFDAKSHELLNANKEKDQLKTELGVLENKLKISLNNYKSEYESRMLSERNSESLRLQVEKLQENIQHNEQTSQDSQKLSIVEKQLTESQAQLILERHKIKDLEAKYNDIFSNSCKNSTERDLAQKKVVELTAKVKVLELKLEQMEKDHKEIRNKDLETAHKQIFEAQTTILNNEQEIERLRTLNEEMSNELTESHKKECDLLQFTKILTEKNVKLQSKFSSLEAKILGHSTEEELLKTALNNQMKKTTELQKEIQGIQTKYKEECDILVRHLATKTEALERAQLQLAESQGEVQVLKRKHAAVIKELNRELQQAKKLQNRDSQMLEECNSQHKGSNSSLSSSEPLSGVSFQIQNNGHDSELLVERILKLQRIKAKQAEKLDFLEEHCKALVTEIQNKTRVMQTLLLHNSNTKADLPMVSSKSESIKEQPQMTLEMSLLMNKNLQTLLEDTLLKNVALKENVDTLASEVMRLSKIS